MEPEEEILGMTAETIGHDLLAAVVDEIKALPDVWQKLNQEKQDDVIERLERRVKAVTKQAVELLASEGRTTLVARIESIAIKDGTKATLVISGANPPSARQELFQSVRKDCLVVLACAEDHTHGTEGVRGEPDQNPLPGMDAGAPDGSDGAEADPLYDEAVRFVLETRRPSISFVQRKFQIGYNRAARLIEAMERGGVVSPMQSNGQREVLVPGQEVK